MTVIESPHLSVEIRVHPWLPHLRLLTMTYMQKPRFRFGLKFILLMMIPLGCLAFWIAPWINDRPIQWVDFSIERLEQQLEDGKTVVVFACADWDATGMVIQKTAFNRKARRWINRKEIVPMFFDTTIADESKKAFELLNPQHGDKYPWLYASVFSPHSRENPIVFSGLFSDEELIEALKQQSTRGQSNH